MKRLANFVLAHAGATCLVYGFRRAGAALLIGAMLTSGCAHSPIASVGIPRGTIYSAAPTFVCRYSPKTQKLICLTPEQFGRLAPILWLPGVSFPE